MNQQRHKPGAISVLTLVLGSWGLLLSLLACGQREKMAGELRIGVIAPVTGNVPGVGDSTVKAAELAVMEVNTAGGLDVANDYNRDLAEFFSQAFSAGGGQIVAYEPYTTGETDFSRQMAAILASAPQVLYLPTYANEVAVQAQQARATGIEAVLLGSDSWELKQLIDLPELNGAFVTTHYAADADYPAVQEFVDAFRQQHNYPPDNAAALTYDAFQLLFQAVQNQSQVDPESIQLGLSEIQEFRGVTGLMLYRGTGDPEKSAVILQIKDGVVRYYKTVNP